MKREHAFPGAGGKTGRMVAGRIEDESHAMIPRGDQRVAALGEEPTQRLDVQRDQEALSAGKDDDPAPVPVVIGSYPSTALLHRRRKVEDRGQRPRPGRRRARQQPPEPWRVGPRKTSQDSPEQDAGGLDALEQVE